MGDKLPPRELSPCDSVVMVTGSLARYIKEKSLRYILCSRGTWNKGVSKIRVQLLLQNMNPVCFRDVVKQQLAWNDEGFDSPRRLMAVMGAAGQV